MQNSFLFIRHGQTDWNVQKRKQGHTDIPLNATGIEQAQNATERLSFHRFDRIITSPLSRALNTATIINKSYNKPLNIEPLLIERYFGELEGKTEQELIKKGINPGKENSSDNPKGAEPWDEVKKRSYKIITQWLERYPHEKILFVGHGAFFRALYEETINGYYYPHNAIPYLFSKKDKVWELEKIE